MVIPSKFLSVGFGEKTASQRHLKIQAVVVGKKRGTRINQLMSPGRSDIKTRNTVTVRTHHFHPMERRLSFFDLVRRMNARHYAKAQSFLEDHIGPLDFILQE